MYFFFGEESYFIDELVALIVLGIVTPETRDFNCDVFQAEEADAAQVCAAASSLPMMAGRRVVVLKSVQKFTPGDREILSAYVRKPAPSTSLILTAGKIDRRQSFYASLIQHTEWAEMKPLYDNQAVLWVENRIRGKGFRISRAAAEVMVGLTGNSLWNLSNEIEKTITFCWGKDLIQPEDVEEIAGFSRKHNPWELSDSVGGKKFVPAIRVLHRIMQEKQSPAGLVMELSRRIVLLLRIRILLDKKTSPEQIRSRLGLNPYFSRLYLEQADRYTCRELEQANRSLLHADRCIKTGTMDSLLALTLVVHDLIHGEAKGRFFS